MKFDIGKLDLYMRNLSLAVLHAFKNSPHKDVRDVARAELRYQIKQLEESVIEQCAITEPTLRKCKQCPESFVHLRGVYGICCHAANSYTNRGIEHLRQVNKNDNCNLGLEV